MTLFHGFVLRDWLLFAGNVCMVITGIFYCSWWTSAFRPGMKSPAGLSALFLGGTITAGLAWIVLLCMGIGAAAGTRAAVPVWAVAAAAVVVYAVLLQISTAVFQRPTTSELFIMLLWACGELCALSVLAGSGRIGTAAAAVLAVLILAATGAGYVCYLKFYLLEPMAAYIDGLLPLVIDSAVTLAFIAVHIWWR